MKVYGSPLRIKRTKEELTEGKEIIPGEYISGKSDLEKGLGLTIQRVNDLNPLGVSIFNKVGKEQGVLKFRAGELICLQDGPFADIRVWDRHPWLGLGAYTFLESELKKYGGM